MSAPEHSPLPWRIGASGLIVDADGLPIYTCTDDPEDTRVAADADLIVAAVNSHAELLAAAKRALPLLGYNDFESATTNRECAEINQQLSTAIARAEQA